MDAKELFGRLGISDPRLIARLAAITEFRHLAKGERLVGTGEPQTHVSFALSGVLRSFLENPDGTDSTDCFIARPGMAAMPCADLAEPSPTTIEALTDCELACIRLEPLEALIQTSLPLALIYNGLLKQAWRDHWNVKTATRQASARDRYLWFLREYPGLIDQVPHRYVASFLGITPVTLSRVRSSLRTA